MPELNPLQEDIIALACENGFEKEAEITSQKPRDANFQRLLELLIEKGVNPSDDMVFAYKPLMKIPLDNGDFYIGRSPTGDQPHASWREFKSLEKNAPTQKEMLNIMKATVAFQGSIRNIT